MRVGWGTCLLSRVEDCGQTGAGAAEGRLELAAGSLRLLWGGSSPLSPGKQEQEAGQHLVGPTQH